MKKSTRAQIAKQTLESLKKGFYINPNGKTISLKKYQAHAESKTKLYRPDESKDLVKKLPTEPGNFSTAYEVTNETTLDAVRRLVKEGESNIFSLNFASAKNPGGGFLKGSDAQEESLARSSGLYPCQLKAKGYYDMNRDTSTCLYTDYMIYSPAVPVFKKEDGTTMDSVLTTSILTSPAVNAGVVRQREGKRVNQIEPTMQKRIRKMLAIALHYQHEVLVLGAWGCGVFQNDPRMIAYLFHQALEGQFKGRFKKVVFAIKTRNEEKYVQPFRAKFG